MRRREFIAALGLLPFLPDGCQRRRRPALALATADTESHVAVLDVATGRVRRRAATVEGPRSIEWAGASRAVVAHTDAGALSLLDGPTVRRVLRGLAEPRYTAVAPEGGLAYVTDSARGEVVVLDLERGRLVGGAEVGALARHLTIAPDGRTLWGALGKRAAEGAGGGGGGGPGGGRGGGWSPGRRRAARGPPAGGARRSSPMTSPARPAAAGCGSAPGTAASSRSMHAARPNRSPCYRRAARRSTSASARASPTWPAATTDRCAFSASPTGAESPARAWQPARTTCSTAPAS